MTHGNHIVCKTPLEVLFCEFMVFKSLFPFVCSVVNVVIHQSVGAFDSIVKKIFNYTHLYSLQDSDIYRERVCLGDEF